MLYGRYLLLLHNEGKLDSLMRHLSDLSSILDYSDGTFCFSKQHSYNIEFLIYQLITINPSQSVILLTRVINSLISIFLSSQNLHVKDIITKIILSYIPIATEYNIYQFPDWLLEHKSGSLDGLFISNLNIFDLFKTPDLAFWLVPLYTKIDNAPSEAAICNVLLNKKDKF